MLEPFGRTKFANVRTKLFSFLDFCVWLKKSCNACHCLALCAQFFYIPKVHAGRKLLLSAQTPVQMLFKQTKNTDSLLSKILQNKSSKFRKMEKRASFLTLPIGAEIDGECQWGAG